MKKYYIGFAVLMAVVFTVFGYALTQASAAKTDHATNKAIEAMSYKLDSYAGSNNVPNSLAEAGVKNTPDTIKYTKISNSKYKICITYKTASSGFDAGWTGFFLGGLYGEGYDDQSYGGASDSSYFNSSVEFNHKKGENCQTITHESYARDIFDPNTYDSSSGKYGCYVYSAEDFPVEATLTVSRVDTTTKTIYFESDNQLVSDPNSDVLNPITINSLAYNDITAFCDGRTTANIGPSDIKAGDRVDINLKTINDKDFYYLDIL